MATFRPRSIRSAAVLYGAGNASAPYSFGAAANKNALGFWLTANAATGDARGMYMRLYLGGAGGGEAVRAFATATAAAVATGGTMNGIHATGSINVGASISGAANGGRFTLGAAAATRTLGGTLAALQVCSDIATGNTLPASHAFIRVTDDGAVRFANLLMVPPAANGTLLAAHTTQGMTHSIKIITSAGTAYYLMVTDAATNRS